MKIQEDNIFIFMDRRYKHGRLSVRRGVGSLGNFLSLFNIYVSYINTKLLSNRFNSPYLYPQNVYTIIPRYKHT